MPDKALPKETSLRTPSHGRGKLQVGNPGNKGGTGQPPKVLTHFLRDLRSNPRLHHALEEAATDPESKGFSSALKVLTEYDDEKPAEKKQIVGPIEVRVVFVREGRRITRG